jgi:hypothetical protein
MLSLYKTVHVLALGLWFGTVVFFTISGVLVFRAFEEVSREPGPERPAWFPLPDRYARDPPSDRFPDPLRLEQGSRAAGTAVGAIFPWYFRLQTICAVLALVTALSLGGAGTAQRARVVVLGLGLATVGLGWWLERVVHDLRTERNRATDAALRSGTPSSEQVRAAEEARAAFGRWHGYSLLVNFATLLLAGAALALAAHLPGAQVLPRRSFSGRPKPEDLEAKP